MDEESQRTLEPEPISQAPFVILIPAYKPRSDFPALVRRLIDCAGTAIVVVDDGSGPAYRSLFDQVAALRAVRVLRHAINLGKGAALKTAMNAVLCDFPPGTVSVTVDADGQHHPDDVLRVARFTADAPGVLVLGVRRFREGVPLRSRAGNELTRTILRVVVGQKLSDTQTGLRAVPYGLLPLLLRVPLQGYEFELEMLLVCRSNHIRIAEVPIQTIYLEGNASSHFNPLLDSMRIYFVLLRFSMLSLATAVLDNLIFGLLFTSTHGIATSQIVARCVAMLFNFFAVKKIVFKSRGDQLREFSEYFALVLVSGLASFGMIKFLVAYFGMGVIRAKLLAEAILFLVNFLVQRDFIFTGGKKRKSAENAQTAVEAGSPTRARP